MDESDTGAITAVIVMTWVSLSPGMVSSGRFSSTASSPMVASQDVELTVADIALANAAPTAAASLSRSSLPAPSRQPAEGKRTARAMLGVLEENPASVTPGTDFNLAKTAPMRSASTSI